MVSPILDLDNRIIYENNGLLVVNKPFDIPTSGRSLDDDDAVQFWLMKRQEGKVWAVHQLDADTTGVNIFVTEKRLVGKYQKALGDQRSSKRYLAIVHGVPNQSNFECREPIGKVDQKSLGVTSEGKSAHSVFRLIDSVDNYSLIEVHIFTGRTHQIRIHLSHLGFPLVGEEWYRKPACIGHPRQALHAYSVNLSETTGEIFCADIALDFQQLLERLGLEMKNGER